MIFPVDSAVRRLNNWDLKNLSGSNGIRTQIMGRHTLVPEVFLGPRESNEAVKTSPEEARREKPLVILDLNLTFKQSPGSGSNLQARIG